MAFLKNLRTKLTGVPSLGELIEEVPEQFERHYGSSGEVFHELVSDDIHVDMYTYPADNRRPYHVLHTTGLAMRPMPGPCAPGTSRLAELMIFLPRSWSLSYGDFEDEAIYWPFRRLKWMARVPHNTGFVLREHMSVPFEDPPRAAPGTDFGGWLTVKPDFLPQDLQRIRLKSGPEIQMFALLALTMNEMTWKSMQPSGSAFRELVETRGLKIEDLLVIRPGRESLI